MALSFLRSKKSKSTTNANQEARKDRDVTENFGPIEPPQPIYLSLLELNNFDFNTFGKTLKANGLLPNSYNKVPEVQISIGNNNSPLVTLIFKSQTSDSYRTFKIYKDQVAESVNGNPNYNGNEEASMLWVKQKEAFLEKLANYRAREIEAIKTHAAQLDLIDQIFEFENDFLEKNNKATFDAFGYFFDEEKLPLFVSDLNGKNEYFCSPFTPKSLEYCVIKLSDEAKKTEAQNIKLFKKKCKEIEQSSVYQTPAWEETINILSNILEQAHNSEKDL